MNDAESSPAPTHPALVLVVLGLTLIATSFASFSFLAKRAWTLADSEAFARVTRDLHTATVVPPRSVLNAEDADLYRKKLESEYERLSSKLAAAQSEPLRWSRWLLWTGAAITALGVVVHISWRSE